MTAPPGDVEPDVEARYRDLLFLHAQAPEYRDLDLSVLPGYADFEIGPALRAVAAAPEDEVPVSARLAVLYDLARAGMPGRETRGEAYSRLADSALALTRTAPRSSWPPTSSTT